MTQNIINNTKNINSFLSKNSYDINKFNYIHVLNCPRCIFQTLNINYFQQHIIMSHKDLNCYKTYLCSNCGAESTEKKLLDEHIILYHANIKTNIEIESEIHYLKNDDDNEELDVDNDSEEADLKLVEYKKNNGNRLKYGRRIQIMLKKRFKLYQRRKMELKNKLYKKKTGNGDDNEPIDMTLKSTNTPPSTPPHINPSIINNLQLPPLFPSLLPPLYPQLPLPPIRIPHFPYPPPIKSFNQSNQQPIKSHFIDLITKAATASMAAQNNSTTTTPSQFNPSMLLRQIMHFKSAPSNSCHDNGHNYSSPFIMSHLRAAAHNYNRSQSVDSSVTMATSYNKSPFSSNFIKSSPPQKSNTETNTKTSCSSSPSNNSSNTNNHHHRNMHRNNFTPLQNHILLEWFENHKFKPYPSTEETKQLAALCGLTYSQVKKWFANKRARSMLYQKDDSLKNHFISKDPSEPSHNSFPNLLPYSFHKHLSLETAPMNHGRLCIDPENHTFRKGH